MPSSAKPDPKLDAVLKRLREDRGLTQEHVAWHAGIAVTSLANPRGDSGQASVAPRPSIRIRMIRGHGWRGGGMVWGAQGEAARLQGQSADASIR
jgi:DNA-binding XRE family transcriptional regulator